MSTGHRCRQPTLPATIKQDNLAFKAGQGKVYEH
jgi:hypothetical protein